MRWPVMLTLPLILVVVAMAGPEAAGERRLDRSKAFEYVLPAGWKAVTPERFPHDLILLPAEGGFNRNIVINDQPGQSTLKVLKGKYERDLARALKDFRLVRSEVVELEGIGRAVRIIHTNSAARAPVRQVDYIVEVAGKRYFIACTVPAADGEKHDKAFEAFVLAMRGPAGSSPIEALNDNIQERFRTLDGFGIGRVALTPREVKILEFGSLPEHLYRFDPSTPKERAAVEDLRRRGLAVGFYLGGRGLLQAPLSESEWKTAGKARYRRMGGPVLIATEEMPADLPRPWELQDIGQKALEAAATSDRYEAKLGRWSVDVRPIRASRAECLKCHARPDADPFPKPGARPSPDLKVGDALGVAVYLYAPRSK